MDSRGRPTASDIPEIDVLRAAWRWGGGDPRRPMMDVLVDQGWPWKLVLARIRSLGRYLDCGTSDRCSWLTPLGEQRLRELDPGTRVRCFGVSCGHWFEPGEDIVWVREREYTSYGDVADVVSPYCATHGLEKFREREMGGALSTHIPPTAEDLALLNRLIGRDT